MEKTKLRNRFACAAATLLVLAAGCLEQPGVGKAAAPGLTDAPGPMGSTTTGQQVATKVKILEDLLDGKITPAQAAERIDKAFGDLSKEEQKARIASLQSALESLPGGVGPGRPMPPGPNRDMILARLYFDERRFIESAMLLSRVLDQDPIYPNARNLLARCFFFLGNPDRTIEELQFILDHPVQGKNVQERLDALFFLGAAVVEQPGTTRENLEKALWAWETYLKEAPESPLRPRVEEGLELIRAGLRGEGRLAQGPVIKREAAMHGPQNVMGGEASFQGQPMPAGPGGPGASGPPPERTKNLPDDATPFQRAAAEGLDALDLGDLAKAEEKLNEAQGLEPGHVEVLVGLGRVYVQTGRVSEALRIFGEAIKRAPDYMPAWHYNGMAHMMSGDPAQAAKSWEEILERDPAYAERFSLERRIQVARRMAAGR